MDFELTQEQRLIRRTARELGERVLAPRAAARDRDGTFPVEELRALAGLGLLGINVPEAYGGAAAGAVAHALALGELAAACPSTAVAVAVTNMVAEVIVAYGTEEQRRAYVPPLTGGAALCGAFALSEPGSGSDPSSIQTVARRTARGWVLDGAKQWITSGDRAGVLVVWARDDPRAGGRGLSAFVVPGGTPGLEVGRREDKMGLRGSSTVALRLDGCELGPEALLGAEGAGLRIALSALDGGRIGIAAQALGMATAAQRAAVAYARERIQFGGPIAGHQAIRFALADSALALEAAWLLTLRAAWRKERGERFTREAAIAKLVATEQAWRICDRAVQIHGGYGYTRDFPVERIARDVRVARIYEGTSEIQRIVIAREALRAAGSEAGGA